MAPDMTCADQWLAVVLHPCSLGTVASAKVPRRNSSNLLSTGFSEGPAGISHESL
jgi:hypothetical protein